MDASLIKSKTVWGSIIAGIGGIILCVGDALKNGSGIPWGQLLPQVITIIGAVVAAIGARDAARKLLNPPK